MAAPTNEDKIHDLLVPVRQLVEKLAPQAEAYRRGDYELTSALLAAAEATMRGLIDERVLLALDMLSETLEAELEDGSEAVAPEAVVMTPDGTVLSA